MKRLALVIALLFITSVSAKAQQSTAPAAAKPSESASAATTASTADAPATKEEVQHYFETMHMRQMRQDTMNQVAAGMDEVMHERLKDQNLPPELEGKVSKIVADALHAVSIDDMLKAIEPVIEKNYTQGELRALVAFYATPYGQSIQKKQPTVTAETMQATQGVIQQLQQDVVRRIQEELAKPRDTQQPSSTDSPKN
jgi:uncharacterized protein